jgi:hypothetical protein
MHLDALLLHVLNLEIWLMEVAATMVHQFAAHPLAPNRERMLVEAQRPLVEDLPPGPNLVMVW